MAGAVPVVIKRLENVTECAICTGDLTDARILPCTHSFCLKCIEKWSQNKGPGEKVSCPICRKEFEISEEGAAALPKNSFVEKLLDVKKLSTSLSEGDMLCDMCCDDKEQPGENVGKKATVYCVDCRRNMCEQCCGHHQKFRLPGVHKLIELNSENNVDELLMKFSANMCDKHADKYLEIYCFDCKAAVCMMCYIMSHNSHKCSDIKEVAKDLGKQMSANVESLKDKVTECQTVLKAIDERETKFCNSVTETEKQICERAERLKQLVEDHKQSLLEQLSVSKDKQLKQTASVRDEIERHQIVLENFIRYSNEVKEKGTACDVAKMASEMNAKSEELQQFDITIGTDLSIDYNVTEVNFSSYQTDDEFKHVFGNLAIDVQGYFKVSSQVLHTIPNSNGSVTGIAQLNGQLYVSHYNSQQIAVYCPTTFQFQQHLSVCQSSQTRCGHGRNVCECRHCENVRMSLLHMVACDFNSCLYAIDEFSHHICKVTFDQENSSPKTIRWSVGGNPQGLSVTSSHNLLVCNANSLLEYTTDGNLIRQISLQPAGITNPVHAVQLSQDQYAVTHHGPKHQFSIVRSNGQLVKSYLGDAGNLNRPRGLAVDQRGRVFVADQRNNRVLVIDSKSLSAYPLRLLPDFKLNGPYSIHYDAANKRLYIGEWDGGPIICLKL